MLHDDNKLFLGVVGPTIAAVFGCPNIEIAWKTCRGGAETGGLLEAIKKYKQDRTLLQAAVFLQVYGNILPSVVLKSRPEGSSSPFLRPR